MSATAFLNVLPVLARLFGRRANTPCFLDDINPKPEADMAWYWDFVTPIMHTMPADLQAYAATMAKHYARRHLNQAMHKAVTLQAVTNAFDNLQREGSLLTAQIGQAVSAFTPPPGSPQQVAQRMRELFVELTAGFDAHRQYSAFLRTQDELDPIGIQLHTNVRAAQ